MAASTSAAAGLVNEYGPDSGGRLKGVKVVKPIIVGNVAKYMGKKREEDGHTHQWTVFLKAYLAEDYSVFIKKVQFKLHDSYPNPNRVVLKPPYEISETGWGEFEVAVKIHFADPVERPVTVYHLLKLFEANKDPAGPPIVKKMINSETYDEIVFMEPTKLMMSIFDSMKPIKTNWKPETDVEEKKKQALQSINQARSIVRSEIEALKNRLKLSRETIDSFKKQLQEAQLKSESSTCASSVSDAASIASVTSESEEQSASASDLDISSVINDKTEN